MLTPLASALAVSAFALAGALPVTADTVYLTNGKSFEGVVAQVVDSQVRIQMPGGELRVPKASVERVESADTPLAEYLQRKQALGRTASAASWLALARWARANGLEQGAREAALKAAQLDPHLEGLAPILRANGYVFDQELDRYVSNDEAMRRRGLVQSGSRWITREEQAELRREREDSQAAEAARAASEAQRQLAEVQIEQQQAAAAAPGDVYASPYGTSLGAFSGFFPGIGSSRRGHGRGQSFHLSPGHGQRFGPLVSGGVFGTATGRVPGSLLTGSPMRRH